MELHWEIFYKKDNLIESCAILAPGVWFIACDSYNSDYEKYLYKIVLHHLTNSENIYVTSTKDEKEHKQNIISGNKYTSIIASSFLGQQHPYRDYPRNL